MKIYIAGNISTDKDYVLKFGLAEIDLSSKGHSVINPVKHTGFEYKDYIDMGLAELSKCEAIYLLKGFEKSKGARLEKHYAEAVGLKILYQETPKNSQAKWEHTNYGWSDEVSCIRCPRCGKEFVIDEMTLEEAKVLWRFCPHCGKMMVAEVW